METEEGSDEEKAVRDKLGNTKIGFAHGEKGIRFLRWLYGLPVYTADDSGIDNPWRVGGSCLRGREKTRTFR